MRLRFLLILTLLPSLGATLSTRDGKFFEGDVQFTATTDGAQSVKVSPPDKGFALTFPLADVASIAFRPPLVGVLSGGTLLGDWGVRDVGSPGLAGSAVWAESTFELRGEGTEFGKRTDAFTMVWQRMPFEGQLVVRLARLADTGKQAMAGLIIRQSLDAQSRYSFVGVGADGHSGFIYKPNQQSDGAMPPGAPPTIHPPCWLKLVKLGDTVYGFVSPDGTKPAKDAAWRGLGKLTMEGLSNGYVGMVVTSRRADELAIAQFDNVMLRRNGLKADFYADAQFTDLRATRIDAKIDFPQGVNSPSVKVPEGEFWVRWTGRLAPTSTEDYSFRFTTGDPARLFIGNQKVLDTNSQLRMPASIKLQAEREYDVRVEYHRGRQPGLFQLAWQPVGREPEVVPSSALIYRPDADAAPAPATPLARFSPLARGVQLVNGTFLPGTPAAFDGSMITFRYRDRTELKLPAQQVARLTFQPLANAAANKFAERGAGLLTQEGEFVEGDAQSIAEDHLTLNSVVLGASTFDLKTQAAAVILRPVLASNVGWIIHTTSGGVFHAVSLKGDVTNLIVRDAVLGEFPIPWGELIDATALDTPRT